MFFHIFTCIIVLIFRTIYCYLIYWSPLKTAAVLYADVFGWDTGTLNAMITLV